MVSSILILSMRQLQRADASESMEGPAGQKAFLKIQRKALDASRLAKKTKEAPKGAKAANSPSKNDEAEQNPAGGENSSGTESDDMIDDLEPLGVQRSFSVPISGPKGSLRQANHTRAAQASVADMAGQKLDS